MTAPGPRRCAAHPSRPARDSCPVCRRPRCAPDGAAAGPRGGCAVCRGVGAAPPAAPHVAPGLAAPGEAARTAAGVPAAADAAAAGAAPAGPTRAGTAAPPPPARASSGPAAVEDLVRAALGGYAAALLTTPVAQEYVGARFYSLVLPALAGLVIGGVAVAAARGRQRRPLPGARLTRVRLVAVLFAALGAVGDFRFNGEAFGPVGRWLPPVLAGITGAWVWTAPPRRSAAASPPPPPAGPSD